MLSLLAAATFVVTVSEDVVKPGDGTSLREAVEAANAAPGPDTITFAGKAVPFVSLRDKLEIKAAGALTIDGDANKDGLADVALLNGFAEKFVVLGNASLTLIGVDLYGGSASGEPGVWGATGADGGQGVAGLDARRIGSGSTITPATRGGNGGTGKDGAPGTGGANAGGIIHNYGKLKLIRVGLGRGYAVAGFGGNGGNGGWGGFGGRGGRGFGASDDGGFLETVRATDGAPSGRSGDGGDGGDAGDGGHAGGAILNEPSGRVELTDVAFGGRLAGWLVVADSTAYAQSGGIGGLGGDGRDGINGGDGGNEEMSIKLKEFFWRLSDGSSGNAYWQTNTGTGAGDGGSGGSGGDRGNDGAFGRNGWAASAMLNLGAVSGTAALGPNGKAFGGERRQRTRVPYIHGQPGLGGFKGGIRAPKHYSVCGFCADFLGNKEFMDQALAAAPGDYTLTPPPKAGLQPRATRSPSSALTGRDGRRTLSNIKGRSVVGILSGPGGVGEVETAASLVYVHPLGLQPPAATGKPPTLDFNVIRIGKGAETVTVSWRVLPAASGATVTGADFVGGVLPSGSVRFKPIPAGAQFDLDQSVRRISLPVRLDKTTEPKEGWRFELLTPSAASVVLGTALVAGRLDDGSP